MSALIIAIPSASSPNTTNESPLFIPKSSLAFFGITTCPWSFILVVPKICFPFGHGVKVVVPILSE